MISAADLIALLPIIVVATVAILLMLLIAIRRHHGMSVSLSVAGLVAAMLSIVFVAGRDLPRQVTPLFKVDDYSLFFSMVFCAAAIAVALLSYGYFKNEVVAGSKTTNTHSNQVPLLTEEFYVLLLVSTLGALILVSSTHFASFFLGLEVLSIPLLVMIAYPVNQNKPIEAGVKFLVLMALASAFLLFGMALIYAQSGTMDFAELAHKLAAGQLQAGLYFIAGVMLIITGVGFKLSVVPFHMWTPDVYQGAPTPVSAYVATISKGAMFAVLMRYFFQTGAAQYTPVMTAISVIAIASMLGGNLLALLQNNIKRVLAYSSIAHLGYLLVVLLAVKALAIEAAGYFLVAYIVTNLGAFGIVTLLEGGYAGYKTGDISEYRGLFWQHPWLAGAFTLMLLSLAGIPLTIGFVGKFYVIAAGVEHALWLPVFIIVVGSAIGLFYYLRIVVMMFSAAAVVQGPAPYSPYHPVAGSLTLIVLTLMLLWLGIYPTTLITIIQNTVTSVV